MRRYLWLCTALYWMFAFIIFVPSLFKLVPVHNPLTAYALPVFGMCFAIVGLLCLLAGYFRTAKWQIVTFSIMCGFGTMWFLLSLFGTLFFGTDIGRTVLWGFVMVLHWMTSVYASIDASDEAKLLVVIADLEEARRKAEQREGQ